MKISPYVLTTLFAGVLLAACSQLEADEPALAPGRHAVISKDGKTAKIVLVSKDKKRTETTGNIINNTLVWMGQQDAPNAGQLQVITETCGAFILNANSTYISCVPGCIEKIDANSKYPNCSLDLKDAGALWSIHK